MGCGSSAHRAVEKTSSLKKAVKNTATPESRLKAAILGGLVADAASMGLHWIYNQEQLLDRLKEANRGKEPEFFSPPADMFYKHADGEFSPYGFEVLGHLRALADQGKVHGDGLAKALCEFFKEQQAEGHYLNATARAVIENIAAGKTYPDTGKPDDAEASAFVKAPVILALCFGRPELVASLTEAIRVQMPNQASVNAGVAAGCILERVVLGSTVVEALAWATTEDSGVASTTQGHITKALERKGADFSGTVSHLGLSCGLPESLQGAIIAAVKFPDYARAVRANIIAGGDNASRSFFAGALLAAQNGIDSVPSSWKSRTKHLEEAEQLIDKILATRQEHSAS